MRLAVGGFTGTVTETVYGEQRDVEGFLAQIDLREFIKPPDSQ